MPPDLKERVKRAAEANNRSMNAEIVNALEEKFPRAPTWSEVADFIEKAAQKLGEMEQDQEWADASKALLELIDVLRDAIPLEGEPESDPNKNSPTTRSLAG